MQALTVSLLIPSAALKCCHQLFFPRDKNRDQETRTLKYQNFLKILIIVILPRGTEKLAVLIILCSFGTSTARLLPAKLPEQNSSDDEQKKRQSSLFLSLQLLRLCGNDLNSKYYILYSKFKVPIPKKERSSCTTATS